MVMDLKEVDLETPAGTMADALADIFMLTPRQELRQQAYRMVGVTNNRDFALAVEERLNTYFAKEQRKLDRRSILQLRREKDDAVIILEHFLRAAGLPQDAVEHFSSKKIGTKIKKLEKTTSRASGSRNDSFSDSESENMARRQLFPELLPSAEFSSDEGRKEGNGFLVNENERSSSRKRKYFGRNTNARNSKRINNANEFSSSSDEDILTEAALKKRRALFFSAEANATTKYNFLTPATPHTTPQTPQNHDLFDGTTNSPDSVEALNDFVLPVEKDKENYSQGHKSFRCAPDDEFSSSSAESRKETGSELSNMHSNKLKQLFDSRRRPVESVEFSSSNEKEFSEAHEKVTESLRDVHLSEDGQYFAKTLVKDDIGVTDSHVKRNPFRRSRSAECARSSRSS